MVQSEFNFGYVRSEDIIIFFCIRSAGAGGGWLMFQGQVAVDHQLVMGLSLTKGGAGGKACYNSTDGKGDGGFGGGGGGCRAGGGGGGYAGNLLFKFILLFPPYNIYGI